MAKIDELKAGGATALEAQPLRITAKPVVAKPVSRYYVGTTHNSPFFSLAIGGVSFQYKQEIPHMRANGTTDRSVLRGMVIEMNDDQVKYLLEYIESGKKVITVLSRGSDKDEDGNMRDKGLIRSTMPGKKGRAYQPNPNTDVSIGKYVFVVKLAPGVMPDRSMGAEDPPALVR